jgi:hypothetical protein
MKHIIVPIFHFLALGCIAAAASPLPMYSWSTNIVGIEVDTTFNAWQACASSPQLTKCQSLSSSGTCNAEWTVVQALRGASISGAAVLFISLIFGIVRGCAPDSMSLGAFRCFVGVVGSLGLVLCLATTALVIVWWQTILCDGAVSTSYATAGFNLSFGGYLAAASAALALVAGLMECCCPAPPGAGGANATNTRNVNFELGHRQYEADYAQAAY